jgi:hypothetical protein
MVTPPSALARNVSGSNLALDFFATAESPCASVADCIIAQPAPRRQACLGTVRAPKNRKGGDRFGSVDLIRLLARRTRSVDWRFACAFGPMDYAPLDRWIMPRGNRGTVLPHARRVRRLADRRDITPNSNHGFGCNDADCFWGTGVFRATSRANLSALNRAVFSRVAKRSASYSAVAF